jgi:uncharacterized protein YndB with AHSA1/START domain
MRALAILLGLSFAGWAGVAVPAPVPDRPDLTYASTVEANGDRILRESILIAASREVVWTAFTTADGLRGWEAPVAAVDLRVGGVMESSYNPKAQLGDANNIKNEILGFLPIELLILRNVQAPSGFKYRDEFARVTTIIQFQDVDARHTRVTESEVGYGAGPAFSALYDFFRSGNAYELEALKAHLEGAPRPRE